MQAWLADYLPDWLALLVTLGAAAGAIVSFIGVAALLFIWAERKVSARIQDRLGPTRTGPFGLLQSLADGIKLLTKEDVAPDTADKFLFRIAPYLAFCASFCGFLALPFANGLVVQDLSVAAFFLLAVLSSEVFGVMLAGYSSGSKWALFGGVREAAQVVSYEVPRSLCVVVPVCVLGTLNLTTMSEVQAGYFWNWTIFHDPFCFVAFFLFFITATASCKRAPFDLAEAESELVAGFHTEYSGLRWSFFFMAEYASMFAVSAIACLLFLGGWYTGIDAETWLVTPILNAVGLTADAGVGRLLMNLFGLHVMLIKASLLVFVQIWVRWTLPRLRIDQVMTTCLKYLVPISCFLFLGAVLWPLVLATAFGRTTLLEGPLATPLGVKVVRQAAFHAPAGKHNLAVSPHEGGVR